MVYKRVFMYPRITPVMVNPRSKLESHIYELHSLLLVESVLIFNPYPVNLIGRIQELLIRFLVKALFNFVN